MKKHFKKFIQSLFTVEKIEVYNIATSSYETAHYVLFLNFYLYTYYK